MTINNKLSKYSKRVFQRISIYMMYISKQYADDIATYSF